MKKLIATIATIMLMVGLVGFSGGTAVAVDDDPYTGSVATNPDADVRNAEPREKLRVRVNVEGNGNAEPKGTLTFVVKKRVNHRWRVITVATRKYRGEKTFSAGKLRGPDKYKVVVKFTPNTNSVYKKSKTREKFRVN